MNDYCYIFAQVLNYHFRGLATAMLSLYLARKDYTLPKQSRFAVTVYPKNQNLQPIVLLHCVGLCVFPQAAAMRPETRYV